MDFDSLKDAQSGLSIGAIIVLDKRTDIVAAIAHFSQFHKHESCGQWTPCREDTWMMNMMNRMIEGCGHSRGIDMLLELTRTIQSLTLLNSNALINSYFCLTENKLRATRSALWLCSMDRPHGSFPPWGWASHRSVSCCERPCWVWRSSCDRCRWYLCSSR